jgi:hypothetical protein
MSARSYPVPAKISSAVLGSTATMDDIDHLVESGAGSEGERLWALKVRTKHVTSLLDRVLGSDPRLPSGVVASVSEDTDMVVALTRDEQIWTPAGWEDFDGLIDFDDVIILTQEEVAFTADALLSGAAGLVLRAASPIAFTDRIVAGGTPPPDGASIIAVVDEMDRAAVLDLLAITAGPHVYRRHDGQWELDDEWLWELKSVKPPIVIKLDDDTAKSVVAQVDEATRGADFEKSSALRGSAAYDLEMRGAEMWLEWALIAGAKSKAYDYTGQMPAQLQKYWLTGRGAAKIRWGTPGAWRRCHRQLTKYMGPFKSKGACTNLSMKLGGPGVATHVGG